MKKPHFSVGHVDVHGWYVAKESDPHSSAQYLHWDGELRNVTAVCGNSGIVYSGYYEDILQAIGCIHTQYGEDGYTLEVVPQSLRLLRD